MRSLRLCESFVCYDAFILVARAILFLLVCLHARADSLDDAVLDLGKRIAARLAPAETAHLTTRNMSVLPQADAARLQNSMETVLRKRIRNPMPVEIALTISENIRGFVLIAEIHRASETEVEIAELSYIPAAPQMSPLLSLQKQFLWSQNKPILDIANAGTQMLVLDSSGVIVYESVAAKWERVDGIAVEFTPVRDPRGRLEMDGESISVHVPGKTCSGVWKPKLGLECNGESEFTASRNTLDFKDWRGILYQSTQLGDTYLVAELDGRVHIYDGSHTPRGTFDGWGDFAVLRAACGEYLIASTAADSPTDTIALYQLSNFVPARISEPVEFAGRVTGVWTAGGKALAIINDTSSGKYTAYAVTANCGQP